MTQKEKQGREHVAAWRASGLSQREYCEQHNCSRSTLGYWSWKVNAEHKRSEFVEVCGPRERSTDPSSAMVEIQIGERYHVRITEGFSSDALRRLLDVIEAR